MQEVSRCWIGQRHGARRPVHWAAWVALGVALAAGDVAVPCGHGVGAALAAGGVAVPRGRGHGDGVRRNGPCMMLSWLVSNTILAWSLAYLMSCRVFGILDYFGDAPSRAFDVQALCHRHGDSK